MNIIRPDPTNITGNVAKIREFFQRNSAKAWHERATTAQERVQKLESIVYGHPMVGKGSRQAISNQKRQPVNTSLAPPITNQASTDEHGALAPIFAKNEFDPYTYYYGVPAYRAVIDIILRETVRNGAKIVPYFTYECGRCGFRYNGKATKNRSTTCDICGSEDIHEPDWSQRKLVQEWFDGHWNENRDKFMDMILLLNYHLQNHNNTYLLVEREYHFDRNGRLKRREMPPPPDDTTGYPEQKGPSADMLSPEQRWPGSIIKSAHVPIAATVKLIKNQEGKLGYTTEGNRRYVCTVREHRNETILMPPDTTEAPSCPHCGRETIPAWAVINHWWASGPTNRIVVGSGEIVPKNGRYGKARDYGFPVALTLRFKLETIHASDEFLLERLGNKYPPDEWLVMPAASNKEIDDMLKSIDEQQDKDGTNPILLRKPPGADDIQVINHNADIKDLDIAELMNHHRETIHAAYGIRPIQARSQEKGTAAHDQAESNKSIYRTQSDLQDITDEFWLMLGVTDWHVIFNPVERTDVIREAQAFGVDIDNAIKIANHLGIDYELGPDDKFRFDRTPEEPQLGTGGQQGNTETTGAVQKDGFTDNEGMAQAKNPSDVGGDGEGSLGSGEGTSPDGRGDHG